MSILSLLSHDEREIIVSLPYRVGFWVSQSDQTGGDEADEKEQEALNNIIHGFSGQVFGSELLQFIMAETLANKDRWQDWQTSLTSVPGECRRALEILRVHVDDKEVGVYARRLIEIGEAVALAFREYDHDTSKVKLLTTYVEYLLFVLRSMRSPGPRRSFDEFVQISSAERRALVTLADALGSSYV